MIPFTRITTCIFFILVLLCTVHAGLASSHHPFMGFEVMLLATLSAALIFSISLFRNFATDLIAILWTGFVTQRTIVIYIWPDEMYYQGVTYDSEVMLRTMVFVSLSALALTLGAIFALSRKRKATSLHLNHSASPEENFIHPINLYGTIINFERLAVIVSWIVIIGIFFRSYVLFVTGFGFKGQTYDREIAILLRLSDMASSLGFIIALAVFAYWRKIRHYKTILIAFILPLFLLTIQSSSKGGLIALALIYMIAFYFVRGFIPKKFVVYGMLVILFTALFYYSLMNQLRGIILEAAQDSGAFLLKFTLDNVVDVSFAFSARLSCFDWLAGIMAIGREPLYPNANLWIDLQTLINTMVPGNIIEPSADYVEISKLLFHLGRGLDLNVTLGGSGEVMGGLGMAYIYFGELFGPIFFFFWAWGCIAAVKSRMHVSVKMFVISFFLVENFTGSGFSTMFYHAVNIFYLSLLIYILNWVSSLFHFSHHPPAQYLAHKPNRNHAVLCKSATTPK